MISFFSKRSFFTFSFYALPMLTILTWWVLAFKQSSSPINPSPSFQKKIKKELPSLIKYLSPMQRETLHDALTGNFQLMIKLITDWDHDAQIMEQLGCKEIKRLTKSDFLRCQLLARQIHHSSSEDLQKLHHYYRLPYIFDDNGNLFDLSEPYQRFLPQSYVAASFLLALSEPETIIALPKGMRDQKNIYPSKITERIKLDADRYNTEKLYEAKPQIAFVADYSHPSTIQALEKQGIPLFTLKHINSPEEIQNALLRIGNIIDRPLEAELLYFFVEAAMQAIDNRFKILNSSFNSVANAPKVLFLKHHLTFSTPTSNTLTGKLLKRLGVQTIIGDVSANHQFAWTIPMYQEQILEIDPDYLIIAAANIEKSKHYFLNQPLLKQLSAKENRQIAFVDDDIQESPSQYMLLAYFDLFEALTYSDIP